MAFTLQQQNIENQQQVLQSQGQYVGAPLDSITLGQLRQMVNAPQRPKQMYYDFDYKDEDTIFEEINEFYSFIEADQLAENLRMWNGSFEGDWTTAPYAQRKGHIVSLLENLEHQESWVRYQASRRLLYLLQGSFAESTSPENQLQWIVENANVVKDSQGITIIVDALKMLCVKYDQLIAISDADLSRINAAPHMRQSWLDEVQAEISMCLGMLYPIIEVFRSDADFAEDLSKSLFSLSYTPN